MKKIISTLLLAICTSFVCAQEQNLLDFKAEVRMDYQRDYVDGDAVKSNSGFKGKYLHAAPPATVIFLCASDNFSMVTNSASSIASATFSLHSTASMPSRSK